MKKILALVLVMMLAAMGLSACSTRTTTTTQATEAPAATDEPAAMTATEAPAQEPAANALSILGGRFARAERVEIPDRDWDHRLCWIEKTAPTPDKYPRKAGKPEKSPL